ncbi:MAG: hypothetical protein HYY87_03315 [Candidatus Levybacteria bacterium]|nr:hypothetical protein [Candidatus Levybacteria bacterium]
MPNISEEFKIIYDGPALQNNQMDVRDLAPALLAVSDVLDEANKILNNNETKIQVNVKGSFRTGSFGVELVISQLPLDQIVAVFNSDRVNAAANLLSYVGFVIPGGGLIGLLLWLKNRKIKKIENVDDAKTVIEVEDEEKYETSPKVIALFSNVKIRTSIQKVISDPLSREGVDTFSIKKDNDEATIKKEEKDYFKLSDVPDEVLEEKDDEVNLQAVGISFLEDNKWRFTDGTVTFFAEVKDEEFIKNVQESKEAFAKNDILRVILHKKQYLTDEGIKTEYTVTKILSHRSSAKQIPLPFEGEKNEEDTQY